MIDVSSAISRRRLLQSAATGFGYLAFTAMMADQMAEESRGAAAAADALGPATALLPARAKRVIFMFMKGGPSQVDTFDHKPLLDRDDGKPLPFPKPRVQFAPTNNLLKSPWKFRPYGQSGIEVSELFPHVAECVDDICFINSMHGSNSAHGGAVLKLHTGSDAFARPSVGSWVVYGLGSENRNLPGFITICPTLAHGGTKNWGSAFLPAPCQGTPIGNASVPVEQAQVSYIRNSKWSAAEQRRQLDLLATMNRRHLASTGADAALEGRIESFELAFRMQHELPLIENLSDESPATLEMYGLNDPMTASFGRQCLLARRFAERGVRFVQVTHSDSKVQWDKHADLKAGHEKNAKEVDKPIAALLKDLKQRGLLQDTLVVWSGEFGRTPTAQGKDGRDHNPEGFTAWLAGAGIKGGLKFGKTDEYGYYAAENKVHLHDLHATLLYMMGLDHEKLTYRYAGRDFRLTDVHGRVVKEIIS